MRELYVIEDNLIIVQGWLGVADLQKDQNLLPKDTVLDTQLTKLYAIQQQIDEISKTLGTTPSREDIGKLTQQERGLPGELFNQMNFLTKFLSEIEELSKANTPPFFHDKKLMFLGLKSDGSIIRINIV